MTISKTPKTERDEREHAEKDIRRQLDELRMDVDGIVAKFHAKLHAVQADIEQEAMQRTSLGKELKSSLEKDLILFKKRCDGDQEIPQLLAGAFKTACIDKAGRVYTDVKAAIVSHKDRTRGKSGRHKEGAPDGYAFCALLRLVK